MAVAVSGAVRVGVDIEIVRPRTRLDGLARRLLVDHELSDWHALAETERLVAFLRAWTATEAVLKAERVGLGGGLRSVATGWGREPRPVTRHGRQWWVTPFARSIPDEFEECGGLRIAGATQVVGAVATEVPVVLRVRT